MKNWTPPTQRGIVTLIGYTRSVILDWEYYIDTETKKSFLVRNHSKIKFGKKIIEQYSEHLHILNDIRLGMYEEKWINEYLSHVPTSPEGKLEYERMNKVLTNLATVSNGFTYFVAYSYPLGVGNNVVTIMHKINHIDDIRAIEKEIQTDYPTLGRVVVTNYILLK